MSDDQRLFVRTKWEQAGTFDEQTGSFAMRRIPAPPEARAVVEDLPFAHERRMTYEIRNACPKCLATIVHRWDHGVTDLAIEAFAGEWPAMKALDGLNQQRVAAVRRAESAERANDRMITAYHVGRAFAVFTPSSDAPREPLKTEGPYR